MLFFYYSTGDLGAQAVRYADGFSLTEAAEIGVVGMSSIEVDDPSGVLDLVGLKAFRVVETADTAWPRLFTGYFADRTLTRAASMLTGAARRWKCAVVDANAALNFEVIQGTSANRPAETDIARLTWWLSSGYQGPIFDTGYIDTGSPVNLDAVDYRGRYGADVLSDCSVVSQKNYFIAWDEAALKLSLHYYGSGSSLWTCALKISNVLADVNQTTVFVPDSAAELSKDPSRVWSGVYMQYGDGSAAVYESEPSTATTFAARDYAVTDPTVKTATKASAKANAILASASTEFDKISVTLPKVSDSLVNQIRAGQRIQVKFTHFPGFTSYTYIRINRRTIKQVSQGFYDLTLELSNTKIQGGGGRRNPAPDPDGETAFTTGSAMTLTRKEASRTTYSGGAAFAYAVVASPRTQSAIAPNTPYTTVGCPLGAGGWGPGTSDRAIFWEFTPTLTATDVGALVAVEVPSELLGQASTGYAYLVVAYGAPTGWNDWYPIGYFQLSVGATVYVPRGLLRTGEVNYIGVAPGWQANRAQFFCAQDLVDGAGGPVVGGEGNSGRTNSYQVTINLCSMSGVGLGVWVAGIGLVNGVNRSFSLYGWTGVGQVLLTINGVLQPDNAYVLSRSALTATTKAPPLEGDVVLWRYRVAL